MSRCAARAALPSCPGRAVPGMWPTLSLRTAESTPCSTTDNRPIRGISRIPRTSPRVGGGGYSHPGPAGGLHRVGFGLKRLECCFPLVLMKCPTGIRVAAVPERRRGEYPQCAFRGSRLAGQACAGLPGRTKHAGMTGRCEEPEKRGLSKNGSSPRPTARLRHSRKGKRRSATPDDSGLSRENAYHFR